MFFPYSQAKELWVTYSPILSQDLGGSSSFRGPFANIDSRVSVLPRFYAMAAEELNGYLSSGLSCRTLEERVPQLEQQKAHAEGELMKSVNALSEREAALSGVSKLPGVDYIFTATWCVPCRRQSGHRPR